ncbi:MAG: hypothetical protein EXS59_00325 [Candidatus Taylorbacteria bacterium]|nr:hypothetical protein [Candidatus Taylorbacteria bacterium]
MKIFHKSLTVPLFLSIALFFLVSTVRADLVEDLKSKIDERNKVIADLEKEIAEYQVQVETTGAKAKTLKTDINALEFTRKKLSAEISVLQNKITSTNLTIRQLGNEIDDTKDSIDRAQSSIATMLRQTDVEESNSLLETVLNYKSISIFLDRIQSVSDVNKNLKVELQKSKTLKGDLEHKTVSAENKRKELVTLSGSLLDKKKVAEYNKSQTTKLLTVTKNRQSDYQKILNQKTALKNSFEQELLEYESQLKFAIDPSSLPTVGSGVLKWPLDSVKITQYFGNTDFAKAHAQVYNGRGHNGIDFRAPTGTAIKSVASGIVKGTGNTDTVCSGASYGKWVLVEHQNGLSTLYAHFSVIKVTTGDSVNTGDVLGYSGETGYATGPHLHFTVYATQGVRIMTRKSLVCQGSYTMPVASLNAYLNPLSYF